MRRTIVLVLTGTVVMATAAGGALAVVREGSLAATSGPSVAIRIEGSHKTLVMPRLIRTGSGWITKHGAPRGKCPASSAQGALNRATHGHWKGKWYSQYNEYLITSILGEKPSGLDFWEIFVNNRAATKGACDVQLQRGEQLVFADSDGKHYPSSLTVIGELTDRTSFLVELVGYNAHGKSKPLAGVAITANGTHSVKTNAKGQAEVNGRRGGRLVLRASPAGYIRSEATVHVAK